MKYDNLYMDLAIRVSQESKCPRKAVGCVIVPESGMLSVGFNGMASGGPNIWDYSEEGNQEVESTAQYRFGGPDGTTLVLSDSSKVTLDGQLISVDSSKYKGAFYTIQKPFKSFTGKHTWAFTDVQGKVYEESFLFQPIQLREAIPASIRPAAMELKFDGLQSGDSLYITIADTSKNIYAEEKKYVINNNVVTIPQATIQTLKPGIITFDFYVKNIRELVNSTKEGGTITQTYTLKQVATTLKK